MHIIDSIAAWQQIRKQIPADARIGFVPTMGNLHAGHVSLLQRCARENTISVLSVFINPTQFNRVEDFKHYPKTLAADSELAKTAGVHYLFCPDEPQMYPDHYQYQITEHAISQHMEGKHRPGHFTGMLSIVMKLLLLIKPHQAYFGEKDYQQLALIKGLAQAFFLDTEIIACDTIREASGLPFSSRNNRLSPAQKEKAELFPKIFHNISLSCPQIQEQLIANGFAVDYIEEQADRRFAAVKIDDIRLIDNFALPAGDL